MDYLTAAIEKSTWICEYVRTSTREIQSQPLTTTSKEYQFKKCQIWTMSMDPKMSVALHREEKDEQQYWICKTRITVGIRESCIKTT